jgi:hypothetical protein
MITTDEFIGTIAEWKLGGIYSEESAANRQQKILNVGNNARLYLASERYKAGMGIPDVLYQEFELTPDWQDEEKCEFYANMPRIATFPAPQNSGMDGIFPVCADASGLINVKREQVYRDYKRTIADQGFKGPGVYIITGKLMKAIMKKHVGADRFLVRAIFSSPELVPQFNIKEDAYPINEDMMPDIKKVLEGEWGRRFLLTRPEQISNSQEENEK